MEVEQFQIVTQMDLHRYLTLQRQAACFDRELASLRSELLGRLSAGALVLVEHGNLAVSVVPVLQRRLSVRGLLPLIGEEAVRELQSRVEPVAYERLIVTECSPARVTQTIKPCADESKFRF